MIKSLAVFVFVVLFAVIVSAQSEDLRTKTLYGSIGERVDGKMTLSEKANQNCFDFVSEKEVACRLRWDLIYGHMRAGEEWDWFQVSSSFGVRTRIVNIGKRDWSDNRPVRKVEAFPELKPGQRRSITVVAVGRKGEDGIPGKDADREEPAPTTVETATQSRQLISTSGQLVKAVEGNMYVIRVVDDVNDFYVLMRVDKLERGKTATISWKRIEAPEK